MRAGKLIKRIVIGLIAAILVTCVTLYLLASWVPREYRAVEEMTQALRQEGRDAAAEQFVNRLAVFDTGCQNVVAFTWSVSQDQINTWLASLDEIHWVVRPGKKAGTVRRGEVHRVMESAGVAGPAVTLHDGMVTVMIRFRRHEKVLSVDLALEQVGEDRVQVRIVGKRVGRLTIPDFVGRDQLENLKRLLRDQLAESAETDSGDGTFAARSSQAVARALAKVVAAIDGGVVSTETVWPRRDRPIRIEKIEISEGMLTLHVRPIRRKTAPR